VPRLLVHVEGETEEMFVNEVFRGNLLTSGYERVGARLLGNARQRDRRGGIRSWDIVRRDIIRHLTQDPGCIATTMIDYYGLPQSGEKAWPGRAQATSLAVPNRGPHVEAALLDDLSNHMGTGFDRRRFLPFVTMHEFEGLLFSDCEAFARGVGQGGLADSLQGIRDQFDTPEDINDSPITAPSKRLEALIPGYVKPLFANLAALEIGLEAITGACPHFRTWRGELEARASLELG
jgi:hypothetical protein